jgi:hypothetical protein
MLHCLAFAFLVVVVVLVALFGIYLLLRTGFSLNGKPMRFDPASGDGSSKTKSWYIEGVSAAGVPISCSFVEFDERGDFLDFNQHKDCQARLKHFAKGGNLLLVVYCHGWKNNSQSDNVPAFNCFLSKFATAIKSDGLRVHGIYLAWRGNVFRPYVDKTEVDGAYLQTVQEFRGAIVDSGYQRAKSSLWSLPENLSYWSRKDAGEFKTSGLPIARSIFTYAAAAKDYGGQPGNRVCVIGHSFGALLLERSLGQATTGAITMEWWDKERENPSVRAVQAKPKAKLPFDFVLLVNSAAPAIYAKELRDFLEADRAALEKADDPDADVPVIVSVTSRADWATGLMHPLGNFLVPLSPSLQRLYTTGIFGEKQPDHTFPTHPGIRQWEFYKTTPGHNRYLINHWIVSAEAPLPPDTSSDAVFRTNLSSTVNDPNLFYTSKAQYPAAAWLLINQDPATPVKLNGLPLSMQKSNYWIVSCGKELIQDHNDIWSQTAMEMYAGLYRAVQSRRLRSQLALHSANGEASQTAALGTDFGAT